MKKDLIKTLTLDEKLTLLNGKDCWQVDDLGGKVYPVFVADGPLGLRKVGKDGDIPAVAYPSTQVLSQTWNPALAYQTGECLGDDCIDLDVDVLLAPGVNIKRDPLCGRNFEYVSEDPYLAGVFGREYIRGVQSRNVGTCLKHFCANNQEYGRLWISSEVDERTLREIYLRPFEIACEADPSSIMCSYNLVNGVRMSEHAKLYNVLRKEFWREDGVIMSDWGAVKNNAASVRAGLDLEMPYGDKTHQNLKAAYERGELTVEQIDKCVARVLKWCAEFEQKKAIRKTKTTVEERCLAAKKVALEGAVLLKNNGVLPVKKGASISVSGEHSDRYYAGGGSSRVQTGVMPKHLSECLQELLPESLIEKGGVWDSSSLTGDKGAFQPAYEIAYGKDVAFVEVFTVDTEGEDRHHMRVNATMERFIQGVAKINPNTVVILHCGAAIDMSAWIDKVAGVINVGYAGVMGNEALAELITGKANFSGKLTETFGVNESVYPATHSPRTQRYTLYQDGLQVGYRYFDEHPEDVRYPFGYGLSYSQFTYSNACAEKTAEGVKVTFTVTNTSQVDGAEIAQVYVREPMSPVYRPEKELKGFDKQFLRAGESKRFSVILPERAFAYYSTAIDAWRVTGGRYEILIGKNAQDICLKTIITL